MSASVEQILVKGQKVGIVGLKEVFEEISRSNRVYSEEELKQLLLDRLSEKNYIPPNVVEDYAKAFLNEYKKRVLHEKVEESQSVLEIKVLGPGCANCERLTANVRDALTQLKISADLEHVRDIKEIGKYGILGTPALIINGQVKAVGKVPSVQEIISWLRQSKR